MTASLISSAYDNCILTYYEEIKSGRIVACEKIRRVYKRLANEIENPDRFVFDIERANHALIFIEKYCRHSKGAAGGKPLILELWQRAFVQAMFGFIDAESGRRRFQEVLLVVGRKNGKSTLSAAIGLYLMLADNEAGAEVYTAATKRDQAKIIWLEAKRMVNKIRASSPGWKSRIKPLVHEIVGLGDWDGCVFRPLGADSERLDGLNVHGALMDEIHAWTGTELYNVIVDGMAAREQPLCFITTTAGFVREGIYDNKYAYAESWLNGVNGFDNPHFLPVIYELDSKDEWANSDAWIKANPGLGSIKDVAKLAIKVDEAKAQPIKQGNLLTKDFNIRMTSVDGWLNYDEAVNDAKVDMEYLRDTYAIGGCDLSATRDLTCATLLIRKGDDENFYVLQQYFLPQGKLNDPESRSDREAPYDLWEKQGWLTVCEGAAVNFADVTAWFVRMREEYQIDPLWVCYDKALSGYWVPEMESYGFDMEDIRQGPITWSYPMKDLAAKLIEKKIIYQGNPMLKWCLLNTGAKTLNKDGICTIQPVKLSEKQRIDGMVSLLNAWVGYSNHAEEYDAYTDRN